MSKDTSEQVELGEIAGDYEEKGEKEEFEWVSVKLSDVAQKRSENVDASDIDGERHIGLEHIEPNTPEPDWEGSEDLSSTKRRFYSGDILFAKLRPNLEKAAQPEFDGVCSTDIFTIRSKEGVNSKYLLYRLSSKAAYDHARRTSVGTRMPRTSWNLFSNFDFELPTLPEQRKIASVLYNVDEAIRKTEEIIEQTKRVKKGVTQNLFTDGYFEHEQYIENPTYGRIPESWEVEQISEIVDRIGSGGTPDTGNDDYYGGEIPWVKTDDLNSNLVTTTKTNITQEGLRNSAAKLFPKDTVVFAMYGGALGQNGRLGMEAAMNQACCGIVTDETQMDAYLLHQQLKHYREKLTALSAGTHQQNITQTMIEKFEILVPPLEEQKRMREIIENIDNCLQRNRQQKNHFHRLKRALMQDLLTGEVRTKDRDIEVLPEVAAHG